VGLTDLVYGVYERRLQTHVKDAADRGRTPKHVGVILDGNRRWATAQGSTSAVGHEAGAAKIVDFLTWCDDANVEVVTLWLLSTDNLTRPQPELEALLGIIEDTVHGL
jgi:Undecaprenyl pyrophosphate synthase